MLISWDGYEEENWEQMEIIRKDHTATLAMDAFDKNLIDKDIWKWSK